MAAPLPAPTHSLALTPRCPTSNTGMVLRAWWLRRSQMMQILSRPELGETATSVPQSQPWPSPPAKTWEAGC